MKDIEDARNKFMLLSQLVHSRFKGDLATLLSSNLQVQVLLPSVSTCAPSLPGDPFVVFSFARRAFGLQSA
jgi:hypothetical protein